MPNPKIIDDDRDERGSFWGWIRAELDGYSIRSWEYHSEAERRMKIFAAREFAEGWYQASQRHDPEPHIHRSGTTIGKHIDECAICGRDIRNPIHLRQ